jgi:hypothetical protein
MATQRAQARPSPYERLRGVYRSAIVVEAPASEIILSGSAVGQGLLG